MLLIRVSLCNYDNVHIHRISVSSVINHFNNTFLLVAIDTGS